MRLCHALITVPRESGAERERERMGETERGGERPCHHHLGHTRTPGPGPAFQHETVLGQAILL